MTPKPDNFKPTKAEKRPCICFSCGAESDGLFWLDERGIAYSTCRCPKCSNKAFGLSILSVGAFMRETVKRLRVLENDVFEIQAAEDKEER